MVQAQFEHIERVPGIRQYLDRWSRSIKVPSQEELGGRVASIGQDPLSDLCDVEFVSKVRHRCTFRGEAHVGQIKSCRVAALSHTAGHDASIRRESSRLPLKMIIPLEDAVTQQSLYKRCNQREAEHAVRSCPEHDVGLGRPRQRTLKATLVALSQTVEDTDVNLKVDAQP